MKRASMSRILFTRRSCRPPPKGVTSQTRPCDPSTKSEHVSIVVLTTGPGREHVVHRRGPHAGHLVAHHGRSNTDTVHHNTGRVVVGRYGTGDKEGYVGIVHRVRRMASEVHYTITQSQEVVLHDLLELEATVVAADRYASVLREVHLASPL